mmetsp:Transcript_11801/g.27023  ORF Transcript_11801/g.27023 Transcript_11801/m.27023 type:complete len:252 (+) Transcript_11801:516-1271(+)
MPPRAAQPPRAMPASPLSTPRIEQVLPALVRHPVPCQKARRWRRWLTWWQVRAADWVPSGRGPSFGWVAPPASRPSRGEARPSRGLGSCGARRMIRKWPGRPWMRSRSAGRCSATFPTTPWAGGRARELTMPASSSSVPRATSRTAAPQSSCAWSPVRGSCLWPVACPARAVPTSGGATCVTPPSSASWASRRWWSQCWPLATGSPRGPCAWIVTTPLAPVQPQETTRLWTGTALSNRTWLLTTWSDVADE